MPASRTVAVPEDDAQDDVPLRMPDTSGNQPNFAAFQAQLLTLRDEDRGNYTRIHFFGTTADGSGGGDFVLTYADGSTQNVAVSFPDWCQSGHRAIGPLSKRWTPTGQDGAPCSIFHVPAEIDEAKELVSVKLPPSTTGGPPEVAYLMALTLERASGDSLFRMPDLSGREPCAAETVPPVTAHAFDPAEPNGGAAGTPARSGSRWTRPTRRAGRASSRCCTGSTAARSGLTRARSTSTTTASTRSSTARSTARAMPNRSSRSTSRSTRTRRPPRRA